MRALLLALLIIATAGCGQKGALIAPEDPPAPVTEQTADDDETDAKARRRDRP